MSKTDRKAAITAYKERQVAAGIYALRCAATGQTWVGRAPDVDSIGNRIRFALGNPAGLRPSLQAAVVAHGASSIEMEILERVEQDDLPYERGAFLKDRLGHWRQALSAEAI